MGRLRPTAGVTPVAEACSAAKSPLPAGSLPSPSPCPPPRGAGDLSPLRRGFGEAGNGRRTGANFLLLIQLLLLISGIR